MAAVEPVLVTGAAGFIGFHVARRLLRDGRPVVGLDNMNAYYDPALKRGAARRARANCPASNSSKATSPIAPAWRRCSPRAASPSWCISPRRPACAIRSIDPHAYVEANLIGFLNILEGCRHNGCRHLVYASSSSVYGANTHMPFSVHDNVDHPLSLYAATKKANELMAHAYAHLFGCRRPGLRFFTVYGPWGRPDMAMWLFTDAILAGEPIEVFNNGKMRRDFTYIDDMVEAIVRADRTRRRAQSALVGRQRPIRARARRPGASTTSATTVRSSSWTWSRLLEQAIGKKAQARIAADAAGRRAGDLCRCRRPRCARSGFGPRRRSPTVSRALLRGTTSVLSTGFPIRRKPGVPTSWAARRAPFQAPWRRRQSDARRSSPRG